MAITPCIVESASLGVAIVATSLYSNFTIEEGVLESKEP